MQLKRSMMKDLAKKMCVIGMAAALRRLNPFTLYWYVLLAAALTAATRLERRGALPVTVDTLHMADMGADALLPALSGGDDVTPEQIERAIDAMIMLVAGSLQSYFID